jgi:hypothetical protein
MPAGIGLNGSDRGDAMIELIDHLPGNVVGIVARGRVTREECDDILRPAMDASARRHGKVRFYYEIGSRYPGAGWDPLDIDASRLERIAIVSDAAWIPWIINALRFLIAGEVRVFSKDEAEEGLAWIAAPVGEPAAARALSPVSQPKEPLWVYPGSPLRSRRPPRRTRSGGRRYRPLASDRQTH